MLKYLKDLITGPPMQETSETPIEEISRDKKLQIATCALFLEVANSDDEFTDEEREKVILIMKDTFSLEEDYVKELIELSEEQIKHSVSLYEFTEIINNEFSSDEKYDIVKNLWRLILVDDKIHHYEDYFIRKISNNLHLSHKELIAAKMTVKEEMGK